jgi:hypothetical protein
VVLDPAKAIKEAEQLVAARKLGRQNIATDLRVANALEAIADELTLIRAATNVVAGVMTAQLNKPSR